MDSSALSSTAMQALYPSPMPVHISDMSPTDTAQYTSLLSHHPKPDSPPRATHVFACRTSRLAHRLPAHLQSPVRDIPHTSELSAVRVLAKLTSTVLPVPAPLCSLHALLNGQIVASARFFLEEAIDEHLPHILAQAGVRPRSSLAETCLSLGAQQLIRTTQDVMALVLTAAEFEVEYNRAPPPCDVVRAFSQSQSQSQSQSKSQSENQTTEQRNVNKSCDACILAHIGSEPAVLSVLGAVALVRVQDRQRVTAAWLEWLEGWNIALQHQRPGVEFWDCSRRVAEELLGLRRRSFLPSSPTLPR